MRPASSAGAAQLLDHVVRNAYVRMRGYAFGGPVNRRTMLQSLLAAAGYSAMSRHVLMPRAPITPGIQLYTVRSLMSQDAPATLAAIAEIGYREVELAGLYGHTPKTMRALLDASGLAAPSTHIGLDELRKDAARVFGDAHVLGNRYVIVPWIDAPERESLSAYQRIAGELNEFGASARKEGIQLGYHNHDFELKPIDGRVPYDILVAETDDELVVMELDLYWLAKGGGASPTAWFERFPGRFAMVHVKDMSRGGEMVDVGDGILDFRSVMAQADSAGIRHAFVEHDEPADPIKTAKRSFTVLEPMLPDA